MHQFSKIVRSLAFAGSLSLTAVAQADLVTNGGFETGDFTGWTQFGNTGFTGVSNVAQYVHSGTFGSAFGAVGSPGGIFQTLATTAGASYEVSFWMSNASGGTPNSMSFNWDGGAAELVLANAAAQGMTQYIYTFIASSASTDLRFEFQHDPSFFGLDDVSVTAVPEPGSLALVGLALALGVATGRKRAV